MMEVHLRQHLDPWHQTVFIDCRATWGEPAARASASGMMIVAAPALAERNTASQATIDLLTERICT